jgi:hypothetical protein
MNKDEGWSSTRVENKCYSTYLLKELIEGLLGDWNGGHDGGRRERRKNGWTIVAKKKEKHGVRQEKRRWKSWWKNILALKKTRREKNQK